LNESKFKVRKITQAQLAKEAVFRAIKNVASCTRKQKLYTESTLKNTHQHKIICLELRHNENVNYVKMANLCLYTCILTFTAITV
jgi:hypothetical protein